MLENDLKNNPKNGYSWLCCDGHAIVYRCGGGSGGGTVVFDEAGEECFFMVLDDIKVG